MVSTKPECGSVENQNRTITCPYTFGPVGFDTRKSVARVFTIRFDIRPYAGRACWCARRWNPLVETIFVFCPNGRVAARYRDTHLLRGGYAGISCVPLTLLSTLNLRFFIFRYVWGVRLGRCITSVRQEERTKRISAFTTLAKWKSVSRARRLFLFWCFSSVGLAARIARTTFTSVNIPTTDAFETILMSI